MSKILVVEDNDIVRNNLIQILEMNNYKIIHAENGLDGFNLAVDELPDLILSDVMMPVMDGYELLKKVRETSPINFTPFIFLTARTSYTDMRYGMNLSADDYLSKPFSVIELLKAVETNLAKSKKVDSKIDQLRDNIAFAIPHEFRTPLTAILGFTDLLKDMIETDSSKEELIVITNNIYDSGIRLNNVINKFILYSEASYIAADSSMIKKYHDSEIESSMSFVKSTSENIARKFGRTNDLKLELVEALINIDSRHLIYFAEELVENACKYSQVGSEITVSSAVLNDAWILSVSDHGVGMEEQQIRSIGALNQFNRKDNEVAGNGLGLSTLKKIIQIYKGEMKIRSEPKKYCTVSIVIPSKK